MIRPIRFLSLSILFLLLSTYFPTYKNETISNLFPIKNIKIENNKALNSEKLIDELEIIKGKNLLFVDKSEINRALNKFDFISGFQVKKIYPSTLKILIFEKKPVALYFKGKNKFYISEKGDLVKYLELDNYRELPLLFGEKKNFNKFFKELKNVGFPIRDIKSFHYFEAGRWDIALKNKRLIKLPEHNYKDMLENFILIKDDKSFDKYKIFDYRVKDQLILN
mgnify:CR=1 FL=1